MSKIVMDLRNISKKLALLVVMVAITWVSHAWAGPVILGGDDLTDHGSRLAGANIDGWLYIENALQSLQNGVTRPGPFTVDIVALGSSRNLAGCNPDCSALPPNIPDPGVNLQNAGSAIGSAAEALGKTITFFNSADRINLFFERLAAGTINPEIIWLAGTGADNDLNTSKGLALTNNAAAINAYVLSGGGLMAHGSGVRAYGWLSALLPGLIENTGTPNFGDCTASTLSLTQAGLAAFPTLSDSDIQVGQCHSNFTGDLGGLQVLAVDGQNRNIIIGGGTGTTISPAVLLDIKPQSCPNPLSVKKKGVLPIAILGTADFDVTEVDLATVTLEGVDPLRSALEDVATPFIGVIDDDLDCNDFGPDGFDDLTLKFSTQDVVAVLGAVSDGDELILGLTGNLTDGTPIVGEDVVIIRK